MKYKIIVSAPYMQPIIDRFLSDFRDQGCEVILPTVNERLSEPELLKIIGDVQGMICGDDRLTRKVLYSAQKLKVISKWGTGIDSIDRDAAAELGIRICNTPNAFTLPVSDSVFAMMLSFARRIPWQDRQMKAGEWLKQPGVSLSECTLGIIGVGNIGKAVARRAAAFGMTILGTDPKEMPADFVRETNIRMVSRDDLLKLSDFVTVNCDLNATSVHLMSDKQFSMMKPGSVLINTARGPIVDEPALIRALKAKRIAGAALDVFEVEPLPEESPLLKMDNVLLSAHNTNSSPAAWERVHQNTLKNLFAGLNEVPSLERGGMMKRVVAITGVAGGIGRGTARVFYEAGWVVVGIDRKKADDVHEAHRFIHADISDAEAPHHIFETIANKEGRLDALVNNAACQICKPVLETKPEEWDQVFACNVRSVFLSVKEAYPLLKQSTGAIVNVSSVHAVATSCGIAAYAASKGALLALTRAMALEFGPEGVRVNAVLPGAVDTPMLHAGLSRGHVQGDTVAKLVRGLGKKHVMGRVGKPHEIGQTILFLADTDRSSFMTGQALIVDGGATARLSTE